MKYTTLIVFAIILFQFCSCKKEAKLQSDNNSTAILNPDSMKLKITVGSKTFIATLSKSSTVDAFKAKLPMTINMADLNANEKHYDLPDALPYNASNPGNIKTGDFMLYGSKTLVLFYKNFSTSYSYTRIGQLDDSTGFAASLGTGNVSVTMELQ